MLGLKLREEFQGRRLKGTAIELANENNTPAGKAIRAALVMITDYLECVMVKQDRCMREFDAADDRRRERTRDSLSID